MKRNSGFSDNFLYFSNFVPANFESTLTHRPSSVAKERIWIPLSFPSK
jgi:hypothetical protein